MSKALSAYARQFLEMMQKPDVEHIDGLSPAISIEQKTTSRNPRSTVATVTEIYDYMRLLWARVGVPYSPATGLPIEAQTVSPDGRPGDGAARGHARSICSPRWCAAARANTARNWPSGRRRASPACGSTANLRDRGCAGARQEVQARHRGGGRSHRGARRHRDAAGRQFRAGAEAGRWARLCRPRRRAECRGARKRGKGAGGRSRAPACRPTHRLFRKVRLPGLRLHHRGDRAAPVLVQRAAGRLPGLRRARRKAAVRSADGRAERGAELKQGAVAPWAKSNPPSPYYMQVLASLAEKPTVSPDDAVAGLPERAARSSCTAPAGAGALTFKDGKKSYTVNKPFEGVIGNSTAACCKPTAPGCARNCPSSRPRSPARPAMASASSPRRSA
jgi:excinuclease ABC subunit A